MLVELPDWVAHLSLFLLGALSVFVFARRQFENSNDILNNSVSEILSSAPISSLAGGNAYGRGLVFYVLIFEIAYFVLSSSTILFSMAYQTAQQSNPDIVGFVTDAIANTQTESQSGQHKAFPDLVGLKAAIPLAVASIIVTLATVPGFSEIEGLVRSLAHSAAGIPRNIYTAIDKISRFSFRNPPEDCSRSVFLADKMAEKAQIAMLERGVNEVVSSATAESIARIFSMLPWVEGTLSLFSQQSRSQLSPLINGVLPSVDTLRTKLEIAINDNSTSEESWEALANSAATEDSRVSSVFGLLAINNLGAQPSQPAPLIEELLQDIEDLRKGNSSNVVVGSLIWGTVFSVFFTVVLRTISNVIQTKMQSLGADATLLQVMDSINPSDFFTRVDFGITNAFQDVLFYAVIFGSATITALSLRMNRIEHRDWRYHSPSRSHYSQYALLGVLTTFIVVLPVFLICQPFFTGITSFTSWSDGFEVIRNSLKLNSLFNSLPSVLVALPIVWSVLKFADHSDTDTEKSSSIKNYAMASFFILMFVLITEGAEGERLGITYAGPFSQFLVDILVPFICYTSYLVALGGMQIRQSRNAG